MESGNVNSNVNTKHLFRQKGTSIGQKGWQG